MFRLIFYDRELSKGHAASSARVKPSHAVAKHLATPLQTPLPHPLPLPAPAPVAAKIYEQMYEPPAYFNDPLPLPASVATMYEQFPDMYNPLLLCGPVGTEMYGPAEDFCKPLSPGPGASSVLADMYEPGLEFDDAPPPYDAESIDLSNFDFNIDTNLGYEPDFGHYDSPASAAAAAPTPLSSPLVAEPISLTTASPLVSTITNPAPMTLLNTTVELEEKEERKEIENFAEFNYDWDSMYQWEMEKWEEFDQGQ